jgi:hypothetical protein
LVVSQVYDQAPPPPKDKESQDEPPFREILALEGPDVVSSVAPDRIIVPWTIVVEPSGGELKAELGGVVSILTVEAKVLTFPARSVTRTLTVCVPSESVGPADCHPPPSTEYSIVAMPDSESDPEAEKVSCEVYQPVPPGGGIVTVTEGGVMSTWIVVEVVEAFPATSVTRPYSE